MLAALGGPPLHRPGAARPTDGSASPTSCIAITAAVVGGCSLSGGVGSIRGTVLGLILIQIVIKGTLVVNPLYIGSWPFAGIDSTQIEGLVLGTVVSSWPSRSTSGSARN